MGVWPARVSRVPARGVQEAAAPLEAWGRKGNLDVRLVVRGFCRGGGGIPTRVPAPEAADGLLTCTWGLFSFHGVYVVFFIGITWFFYMEFGEVFVRVCVCFVIESSDKCPL